MLLFALPFLALGGAIFAAIVGGIVFAIAWPWLRRPQTSINRFGSASTTANVPAALIGSIMRSFNFTARANRMDFWSLVVAAPILAIVVLALMVLRLTLFLQTRTQASVLW